MADPAHEAADRAVEAFKAEVREVYLQAETDAQEAFSAFLARFEEKDAAMRAKVEAGELSRDDWLRWRKSAMLVGKRHASVLEQAARACSHANETAMAALSGRLPEVYAENANFAAFEVCRESGLDLSFDLVDADTVRHMLTAGEALIALPALNVAKDLAWNRKLVASQLTQGVLLGESIPKLAKRVQRVVDSNYATAVRTARTAVTGAENAGRVSSYRRAQAMGIDVEQEWLATLDGRTRHSHRRLDGERAPVGGKFSNGCRYPGDPEAAYAETMNCRCTLVPAVAGIDQSDAYRWSRLPAGMTYGQWKAGKAERAPHDSSGRTMGEFFEQPSVKAQLEKRGMSEAKARGALSAELKRRGTDGNAFRRMQRSEQQAVWRDALQSRHAQERMAERGVTLKQVDDAVANPLHAFEPTTDKLGRRAQKLIGKEATVVVNPDTGVIITTYKTGRRERRKYGVDE